MQSVQKKLKEIIKKREGSVLIGVIVLTAVMSIAAAGLIGVARNMASAETEARDDTGAFILAESGLNMGMGWLWTNRVEVFNNLMPEGSGPIPLNFGGDLSGTPDANGFTNNVFLERDGDIITVVSQVGDPNRRLPYNKELRWSMTIGEGGLGALFGVLLNTNTSRDGLASGFRFEGDMHSNAAINLSNQDQCGGIGNAARFLGDVTVFSPNATYAERYSSEAGDQFRKDIVQFKGVGGDVSDAARAGYIQCAFEGTVRRVAEKWVPRLDMTTSGRNIFLGEHCGETPPSEATLEFSVVGGAPRYRFTCGTTTIEDTYDPAVPTIFYAGRAASGDGAIERDQYNVTVDDRGDFNLRITSGNMAGSGNIMGQVTVATGPAKDIKIDLAGAPNRSLVYDGLTVEDPAGALPMDEGKLARSNIRDVQADGVNNEVAIGNLNDYIQNTVENGLLAENPNQFAFFSGGKIDIIDSEWSSDHSPQHDRFVTAHMFATEQTDRGLVGVPAGSGINRDGIRVHVIGSVSADIWGPTAPPELGGDHWHNPNRLLLPYHDLRDNIGIPGIHYLDEADPNNIRRPDGPQRFAWREINRSLRD